MIPTVSRYASRLLAGVLLLGPACGGSSPAAPPPPSPTPPPTTLPPPPATLADLSAAVTSPQADASLNCTDDLRARVTVTNRAAGSAVILGILNSTGIPAGDCGGEGDFIFTPLTRTALGNSTTVVLDQSLYDGGPGCCLGRGCAGSCRFLQSFQVITDVGQVPAGEFQYRVFFQNCPPCEGVSSAGAATCRRAVSGPSPP